MSRGDYVMQLIRTQFFYAAEWDIHLVACQVPGFRNNIVADTIS